MITELGKAALKTAQRVSYLKRMIAQERSRLKWPIPDRTNLNKLLLELVDTEAELVKVRDETK